MHLYIILSAASFSEPSNLVIVHISTIMFPYKFFDPEAFKCQQRSSQKYPCTLIHTMSTTSIPTTPTAKTLPPPAYNQHQQSVDIISGGGSV